MSNITAKIHLAKKTEHRFHEAVISDFKRNKSLYLMALPMIIFYVMFHYKPMYGAIIAFKDFNPSTGIWDSAWVGVKHFRIFFESYYFWRIIKNTLVISVNTIIFGFPAPIILALMINEIKVKAFKGMVQTISYLPHFISLVVICGMIKDFTSDTGIINYILSLFGIHLGTMLNKPGYFVPVYVVSDVWQSVGWGSIIYLSALTGIDPQLYEAAIIDGAGRWKQTLHVTIPGIIPTIIIMFILRVGSLLNVGYEKIILLYNPVIYETSDVISSFVYRKGLQEFSWSFSAAVGLFNSFINFTLLIMTNMISKKTNETSLW